MGQTALVPSPDLRAPGLIEAQCSLRDPTLMAKHRGIYFSLTGEQSIGGERLGPHKSLEL